MREHLSGNASPTERTMAYLRSLGYTVDKVEQRVPFARVTRDLFGCIDIVALKNDPIWPIGVLGVQATTGDHVAERVKKIAAEPRAALWRACGNRLWVVGWTLAGPAGTRKVWTPRVVQIGDNSTP